MRIVAASAPLRRAPQAEAPLETEALHGESVMVYDEQRRVGLGAARARPVCWLSAGARRSARQPSRPIGSRHCAPTPIPAARSSCLRAWRSRSARSSRSWASRAISRSRTTGFISGRAISRRLSAREPDAVAVAERFLETPYLWGGRTSEGIDCSGLVQTALTAAGIVSPRDSDMQEATLGEPSPSTTEGAARAWRSHVLEGPCRNHARSRHAASRQRLAHEGGQRAARRRRANGSPPAAAGRSLAFADWRAGRARPVRECETAAIIEQRQREPTATSCRRGRYRRSGC